MINHYAYLGCVLDDPKTLDAFPLDESDFSGCLADIFCSMSRLHEKNAVSIEGMFSECKDSWMLESSNIIDNAATGSSVHYHWEKVRKSTERRNVEHIPNLIDDRPTDEIVADIENVLKGNERGCNSVISARDIAKETMKELDRPIEQHLIGLKWLDKYLFVAKQDLVIVGGRPGMGKTAFLLKWLKTQAKENKKALVFSLEMSRTQLMKRMAAAEACVNADKIKRRQATPVELSEYATGMMRIAELPFSVDDTAGISIAQIKSRVRREKPDIIFIDYLQLVYCKGESRRHEIEEISRQLKIIAKEHNIPVVAMAQLSRNLEQRPNKRPILSDLREAGGIEQDADIVLFLYRESEYCEYIKQGEDCQCSRTHDKTAVEIIIGKQREGECKSAFAVFRGEFTKFSD